MADSNYDLLGFAKQYAGRGIRTAFDPEDDRGDEGENLTSETVVRPPKHRAKQKSTEVLPGNPQTGASPSLKVTLINKRRDSLPCWNKGGNQGHAPASHIFYTPKSSVEGGVGKPLCPTCLAAENESLKTWRAKNPDIYVKEPESITPEVLRRQVTEERGMEADKRAFVGIGLMKSPGGMPEDFNYGNKTPYAGPGRAPGSTKTPRLDVSEEYKKTALDKALERAKSGEIPEIYGRQEEIGKAEEERRSAAIESGEGYYKHPLTGKITRYYKPIGEAAKGKRKPIGMGNYVPKKDAQPITTPLGEGNAPIDKVLKVAKTAKAHGTYLDKDIWNTIIKEHGEGVVKPEHVISAVKTIKENKAAKTAPKTEPSPLPIPRRAGAFAKYAENVRGAGETKARREENEAELWGYLSRNDEFDGGSGR